ncbi:J domain-containing protein [Halobacteriaceae archaeon GCM10025711]
MTGVDWPAGFDRTPSGERKSYPHGFRVSQRRAFENILTELQRLGAEQVKIESGAEHQKRNPNLPYADATAEDDPAVVVYFTKANEDYAVPCDRWDNVRDNAQAIAKYLNAKRALDRYGVETIESEFSTQALPPGDEEATPMGSGQPTRKAPHEVLHVAPDADADVVKAAARSLKKQHHPDQGGDVEQFKRVVNAEKELLGNTGGDRR